MGSRWRTFPETPFAYHPWRGSAHDERSAHPRVKAAEEAVRLAGLDAVHALDRHDLAQATQPAPEDGPSIGPLLVGGHVVLRRVQVDEADRPVLLRDRHRSGVGGVDRAGTGDDRGRAGAAALAAATTTTTAAAARWSAQQGADR